MTTKTKSGKPLVIVESPAKARTISKFLGSGYEVEASIGHVRDLPESADEIPEDKKKEKWARLGVDVEHGFEPLYVIPSDKLAQVKRLRALLKQCSELYLATDEDREGESISWHLHEILAPKVPVRRLVFHEITREAIQQALKSPRSIDRHLVAAQETRRIVDRLYGYEVSPLLWKKVRTGLSAGRVQSVAIRLVVERERQRMAFHASTWWDLVARFGTGGRDEASAEFDAQLVSVGGKRVAAGKDFDPHTGALKAEARVLLLDELAAATLRERLLRAPASVESLEEKPFTETPQPPFTTSTLQQEANRKLRLSARRTMEFAQRLYENGYITYMRTDSTTLSEQAIAAARAEVQSRYGKDYLAGAVRQFQTKVRNAQEAHEAIRPAGAAFTDPDEVRRAMGEDAARVYDLIWKRTVACQMADARGRRMTVTVAVTDARFEARGKVIDFPGYLRAYVEGSDDPEAELAERETVLPAMRSGDRLRTVDLLPKSHTTQPPARLTEATLIKELEARGIGRPSTYASIIDTILQRDYVFKRGTALVPSFTAFAVVQLMEGYLQHLVDYGFTAHMEEDLDRISLGEAEKKRYLHEFYFGNGRKGLRGVLDEVVGSIDPRTVCTVPLVGSSGSKDEPVARIGRYGPYLELGETRATLPDDLAPDELTLTKARELIAQSQKASKPLGNDPITGLPVFAKNGRFGPYVQLGVVEKGSKQKPKMASLLKGQNPETLTLEQALDLLSLPRDLGKHPDNGESVLATVGRYGPYLKCGAESRSIPEDQSVLTITLEQALAILKQPKAARRFGRAAPAPKRILGKTEAGAEIKLMDGRFGPYVTDGTTNASLPKGQNPDELSLPQALELIRARAERGPSRKPARRGRKKVASP